MVVLDDQALGCAGAWGYGTVTSRRHDNNRQQHHHHELHSSSSTVSHGLVYCEHDDDCRQQLDGGQTCHWLYDGCSTGICMCDPLNQKKHPHTRKCIPGTVQQQRNDVND